MPNLISDIVSRARQERLGLSAGGLTFTTLLSLVPLLAVVAFDLGKRGFAIYLSSVPTIQTVYGAFAPALAFVIWVYYTWFVTLAAAVVSANLARGGKARARRD